MPECDSTLERAYRRLLLAYPRFYRRLRGPEMLTTLLDAAKPGQTRPHPRDAVHLVLAGLRMRLVPHGWAGPVVAVVATLWLALVLGGTGAYAVWADRITFPHDSRLDQLADSLGGGEPTSVHASPRGSQLDMAYTFRSWSSLVDLELEGWTGADPAPFEVTRSYNPGGPPSDAAHQRVETAGQRLKIARQRTETAHQRLRAYGWRTGQIKPSPMCECWVLWASRDGAMLRLQSSIGGSFQVSLHAVEPAGLRTAAAMGAVLGVVLAWPVMTWLTHRFAYAGLGPRLLMLAFGLPALTACAINCVDNVMSMIPGLEGHRPMLGVSLIYPLANQFAFPIVPLLVVTAFAVSVRVLMRSPSYRSEPMITADQTGNAH